MSPDPSLQPEPWLSEAARDAVEDLVRQCLSDEKTGRRAEVKEAWKQRSFRRGAQQIYYDPATYTYMDVQASGFELPEFRTVYNIWAPHARSFSSILSQNPPGINFVPDDLQRPVDVSAAAFAEKMRSRVDRMVHMKDRQGEIADKYITDGRTGARVWVDGDKLRIEVDGVLEWKVPLYCGNDLANWGYAIQSKEVNKWKAKYDHPDFAARIDSSSEGSSETNYERTARLGILANSKTGHGNSDAVKNLVTRHIAWIRPFLYARVPDEIRPELNAFYPQGLRATLFGSAAVDIMPAVMEEEVVFGWPSSGESAARNSLLHDLTAIQQDFNDYMNLLRTHIKISIPATWVTADVDEEALAEQRSSPGAIHQIVVPSGASISDLVFQEQVAQLPPELVANLDRLLSLAQFTTGDLPSLSGEGDPHSETATGQKMLSDQAKGQLSPAWQGLQWQMAQIYEIAVRSAAMLSAGIDSIAVQGGSTGQQRFNPQAILDGAFSCHPDTDSSFPETMADKRAAFQSLTERLGAAGEAGLAIVMHPGNLKLGKQLGGLKEFVIPGADARDKQDREIEQLLQESPVPDEAQMTQWQQAAAMAHQQGQPIPPMPMKSSVDVGKRDYHQAELDEGTEWLSSPACHEEHLKGNDAGIQNVELHLDQHEAALAKIAQANAPKPEPPKISLTGAITDSVALAQLLGEAGVQTTPQNIQASTAPQAQETQSKTELNQARTQHASAQAQHASVLAARDEVTPIERSPTPDELNEKEK